MRLWTASPLSIASRIVFNYDNVQWEAGDASGGFGGHGGSSAVVGFSNGSTTAYQLAGSAMNGALLNGGVDALNTHSLNSNVDGRYIFMAREGTIQPVVPEPTTLLLLGSGLIGAVRAARRRRG